MVIVGRASKMQFLHAETDAQTVIRRMCKRCLSYMVAMSMLIINLLIGPLS